MTKLGEKLAEGLTARTNEVNELSRDIYIFVTRVSQRD